MARVELYDFFGRCATVTDANLGARSGCCGNCYADGDWIDTIAAEGARGADAKGWRLGGYTADRDEDEHSRGGAGDAIDDSRQFFLGISGETQALSLISRTSCRI